MWIVLKLQKIENMTNKNKKIKTKSIEIERCLCIKLFTNIKSFGPSIRGPPLCGPSLLSAPAELIFRLASCLEPEWIIIYFKLKTCGLTIVVRLAWHRANKHLPDTFITNIIRTIHVGDFMMKEKNNEIIHETNMTFSIFLRIRLKSSLMNYS